MDKKNLAGEGEKKVDQLSLLHFSPQSVVGLLFRSQTLKVK